MKSIRIKNVKSFKDSGKIEIKPLTLIVGENNCGKSSLIRFLPVLSQTISDEGVTPLLLNGKLVDYGSFESVRCNSSSDEVISFSIGDLDLKRILGMLLRGKQMESIKNMESVDISVDIIKEKNRVKVKEIVIRSKEYSDGNFLLKYELKENLYEISSELFKVTEKEKLKLDISFNKFLPIIFSSNFVTIRREEEIIGRIKSFLKIEGNLDLNSIEREHRTNRTSQNNEVESTDEKIQEKRIVEIFEILQGFDTLLKVIGLRLYEEIGKVVYIGPFREAPRRMYTNSESRYSDVGIYGENTSHILKQMYDEKLPQLSKISEWFKKSLDVEISILEEKELNVYRIFAKNTSGNAASIIDSGYGVSQVLPIVSQLYNESKNDFNERRSLSSRKSGKTIIIEQPELHLHPRAQSELADLFVDIVKNKEIKESKENKVIIETHSEHLIRKLQVLVAQEKINKDEIAIYYIKRDEINGAQVTKMELSETGQFLTEWPSGFFDKSYELSMELFRSMKGGE